ncbi:hypothetical protein H8356DRAFT_1644587 [Neocallimastix lanati (nom. inval.)]|uniref:Phosphatidylinositol N-acetylglucosaminyltransferase subunit H conserved domain-containing protein n=1 Tax=Neocallimastix californiae TaxID=1754190 RepID=A0A1Y2CQA2_9FUNG|nr:hypothetical protein H8356DRAFT_1644587 [Neocallimastix sp. JGI-2020a]ORY49219.1 hypothetical protein LY90DRAFT_670894 [Neocallimastix californiae]|eukprot:ORY49219.1 hypothetical protein LY90DRAFT_670894 [Neocallimastix californiae]
MSGLNSNNLNNIKGENIRTNSNENKSNTSINNQKNNNINSRNNNNTKKNRKNEPEFIYKIHADNAHEFIMKSTSRLISNFDIFLILIFAILLILFIKKKQVILCILVIMFILLFIYVKCNTIIEESLLVVRDLGVQIKTTYPFRRTYSRFIDKSKIGQIIINEGITAFQVKFYLAVLISGEDHMEVVYKSLIPKLKILKFIYKESNEILKPNFIKDQLGLI